MSLLAELRALHLAIGRNIAGDPAPPIDPAAGRPAAPAQGPARVSLPSPVELPDAPLVADQALAGEDSSAAEPVALSLLGVRAPKPPNAAAARELGRLAAAFLASGTPAPAEGGRAAPERASGPDLFAPATASMTHGTDNPADQRERRDASADSARARNAAPRDRSRPSTDLAAFGHIGPDGGERMARARRAQIPSGERASADAPEATGRSDFGLPPGMGAQAQRVVLSALGLSFPTSGVDTGPFPFTLPSVEVERAGIIASFVLNAAMIPGWPPPRPLEGTHRHDMAELLDVLTREERDVAEELSRLLKNPALLEGLLRRLLPERRRLRLMAALTLILKRLGMVLEAASEWAENAAEPAGPAPRERLVLR